MTGQYNFKRSFWWNVFNYRATNEPRYMWSNEHQAITNVIATRSAIKLTLGLFAVLLLVWVRS